MWPWLLAICLFICGCNSGLQGNQWASQDSSDQEICESLPQAFFEEAKLNKSSSKGNSCDWCFETTSQLERLGVFELGESNCSTNGLAMQPVLDMGGHTEGTVHRMRTALVEGMEETQESASIAKSETRRCRQEGRCRQQGGHREGGPRIVHSKDSLDSEHSEYTHSQQLAGIRVDDYEGGYQGDGGWGEGFAARTSVAQASSSEFVEGDRASQRTQRSHGTATRGVGSPTATARSRKTRREGSQSWAYQQNGEIATTVAHTAREGAEVGRGLEAFCDPGPGQVQQAQGIVHGYSQAAPQEHSGEEGRSGACERRNHESLNFLDPATGSRTRRRTGFRAGGCSVDGEFAQCTGATCNATRVSRSGNGRCRREWAAGGFITSTSQTILQESDCRITLQSCEGALEAQGGQEECRAKGNVTDGSDTLQDVGKVSVECVLDDVFAGSWVWCRQEYAPAQANGFGNRRVSFNPMVEVVHFDPSPCHESCHAEAAILTPCPCDRWCVEVCGDAGQFFQGLEMDNRQSHISDSEVYDGDTGLWSHDDEGGDDSASLMQIGVSAEKFLLGSTLFQDRGNEGKQELRAVVWLISKQGRTTERPYGAMIRKGDSGWQSLMVKRWKGLYGDGDPQIVVATPYPPKRDVDFEFPNQDVHVLVSLCSGTAVLLDVECPEWKMRDAWIVHATTVADLFVRVGLVNYLHNQRFECVLDDGGTILSADQRVFLKHGYYGKLIVTELVEWIYEPSGESSDEGTIASLSTRVGTCGDLDSSEGEWNDGMSHDMMSLFQSFSDNVANLNVVRETEHTQCRFLEEGRSYVDSLFVDVPDFQDDFDDESEDAQESDDFLRTSNPHVLHQVQARVPADPEGRWRLVSFGLREFDIGRRDATLYSLDQAYIEQAVWMLWQDEVPQFAPLVIHYVVPQPLNALGLTHAIVVIAEILKDSEAEAAEVDNSAILSVQVDERGQILRQPKAHYAPSRCTFDRLHMLHEESFMCSPQGVRRCSLRVGGRIVIENSVVDVISGSLNLLELEVMMPQFLEASLWFPRVEVWASHVTSEFSLDQVDDFLASIYIPGRYPISLPFVCQDLANPENLKRKVSDATQLTDFVILYLEDNVLSSVSRDVGRHHHFMIWDTQAVMQPILVMIEGCLDSHGKFHIAAIDPQGLHDINELQVQAEMQLGLDHTERSCTQRGHVVGFYAIDPEAIVVFRCVADAISSEGQYYPMDGSESQVLESDVDSMSLLQRGTTIGTTTTDTGYTEDNSDLRSGQDVHDAYLVDAKVPTPCPRDRWCVGTGAEANAYRMEQSIDPRLSTLHALIKELREEWPKAAFTSCYDRIPNLHPFARLALASGKCKSFQQASRYHVFTDGSAQRNAHSTGKAAWAFHVVCESTDDSGSTFHRIGVTGGLVDQNLWRCQLDALDAEAMALIHVADWLISQRHPIECTVHFDAKAVGFGAFGFYNVACDTSEPREIQRVARALFAVAQAFHPDLDGAHVKAHDGQPDNEIADSVAFAILRGWEPSCNPPCRVRKLVEHPLRDWAWMECAPSAELPSIETALGSLSNPAKLGAEYLEVGDTMANAKVTSIDWKFGSANVCTLDDPKDVVGCKVGILQRQALHAGYDIFVLQETRGRKDICSENDDFLRIGSAAHGGQGGVEVWFRKKGPFLETGFGEIQKSQLVAWHADHRILGLSILHPALECDIVGIYAPQSGRSEQEIKEWWSTLLKILEGRPSKGPLFLIGDANAKIGAVTSSAIGDLSPDFEDQAGEMLREVCSKWALVIPSTFGEWHYGATATFASTRGGHSRVDYIAVPDAWRNGVTASWVDDDFDLLNGDFDHKVIAVSLTLQVTARGHKIGGRRPVYDRGYARTPEGKRQLAEIYDCIPVVEWQADVNDHWALMRSAVVNQCQQLFPKTKRTKRQLYLSDQAWDIVCQRKDLTIELRHHAWNRARWLLWLCWRGWRGHKDVDCVDSVRLADQQAAIDLWKKELLNKKFRQIRNQERKQWSIQCADQLRCDLQSSSVGQWFKLIKPKRALKHTSQARHRLPGMKDEKGQWVTKGPQVSLMWQRHFGAIENADEGQACDILLQSKPRPSKCTVDDLVGTPSLFDLERAIRNMNAKKAAGPDQIGAEIWQANVPKMAKRCYALFLKSGLRHQWVAEFSGGDLVPLFKKGDASCPGNYRAILLEPVLGRVFSRAWRRRLNEAMHMVQAPFQFGGHRAISIEIAHLLVRNAQQISAMRKRACALIFADIKSAFYSVAKPFLSSDDVSPEELVALFHRMKLPPENLLEFIESIDEGVVIPDCDDGHLRGVVASMIRHSWAKVPGADRYILPRTGSRPGDPLADTLYGFLMAKCMHRIADRFDQDELTTIWSGPESATPALAWVDDAVFHIEAPPVHVLDKVTRALQIIHEEMLRMGLQPNYGVGKTEVLLSFKGKQATQVSQKFHKGQGGVLRVLNETDGMLEVRTVTAYKHLGGFVTRNLSLHPELRVRGAQTQQQLKGLKHAVLSDPALPLSSRQMVLKSLGLSVLTLHSGTWRPLQLGEWKVWQGLVHTAYQQLHRRGLDGAVTHLSMLELAVYANSPMPHGLLHIRRLRVFTQFCKCHDAWMLDNILCSARELGKEAWIQGVKESLMWAKQICDDRDWISLLDHLECVDTWSCLQQDWRRLHRLVKKVEIAHCLRNKMCVEIQQAKKEHDDLLQEIGWHDLRVRDHVEEQQMVHCQVCGFAAKSHAGLAVHEQRVHGKRIIARRIAMGTECSICKRSYHTRPRLILHLQYGSCTCLVAALRRGLLCSEEEALLKDQQDIAAGNAHHMRGIQSITSAQPYFIGDEVTAEEENPHVITEEERNEWSKFGLLPVKLGGRPRTTRYQQMPVVFDSVEELGRIELQWQQEAEFWQPPDSEVPRPLVQDKLYFLVFFAGHRRSGDLVCHLEWKGEILPIPIDLTIDKVWGDARRGGLWEALIRSGKVLGAHMGPPCETFSDARWLDIPSAKLKTCPRPLRDALYGWGLGQRSLKELKQVNIGNYLLWLAFTYLILIDLYGGCASLEHPKGIAPERNRFSVWVSSLVRRLTRSNAWTVTSFLQGPLGVAYAKPTRLLHLRLPELPSLLFGAYDVKWKPREVLGGLDEKGVWKTMKAKAYPERMNAVLADAYSKFFHKCHREGHSRDPEDLGVALEALTGFWDPYVSNAKGSVMAKDYHGDTM